MKNIEWGEFRIGRLFEKVKTNSLKYKTSELPDKSDEHYSLPALTAGIQNQGLNNFVPRDNATILKNVISVSANGANTGVTFFQSKEFTVLQDAYAIDWINTNNKLRANQYIFLAGVITKTIYGNFEWTNKAGWTKVKEEKIQLPTKNGKIDFDFMASFVAEIKKEQILKLEKHLDENGLSDYHLTEKETQTLENFESGKIKLKEYELGDLFTINTYKKRFDANKVNIAEKGEPYVVRTSINNGVRGYIDEDKEFLNEGNTISFGQDTATVYYQEQPYFTGDKIKIVKAKDSFFNRKNAFYFIASMTKSFSSFSWGGSSFSVKIIKEQSIQIPIKENKPDYKTMETIISAIHKLVIKDVVLYVKRKKKELKTKRSYDCLC